MIRLPLLIGAFALLAACGHDHDHGEDGDHLLCFGDEEATAGAAKVGDQGNLKVHVVSTVPSPLHVGLNTITIQVTDTADNAMADATMIGAETWQRVHDHGDGAVPEITTNGGGEFTVAGLGVSHTGSWLFRFEPEAGGQTDFVEFNFGVECPPELNE